MATTYEITRYPSNVRIEANEGVYSIPCDADAYIDIAGRRYKSSYDLANKLSGMNNQAISRVLNRLMSLGYASYCGA